MKLRTLQNQKEMSLYLGFEKEFETFDTSFDLDRAVWIVTAGRDVAERGAWVWDREIVSNVRM